MLQKNFDKDAVSDKLMENGAESAEEDGEGNEAEDIVTVDDREYTYDEVCVIIKQY